MPDFLQPDISPAVIEGEQLEDAVQETLAGIAGLAPEMARPRWQPNAPNPPDFGVDWAAFGITNTVPDTYAYEKQITSLTMELQRDEAVIILASFYGANAQGIADRFNDGLQIQYNRAALASHGLKLTATHMRGQVPALLKETWVKRYDIEITLRRRKTRRYSVGAIESVNVDLDNEFYVTPIIVTKP